MRVTLIKSVTSKAKTVTVVTVVTGLLRLLATERSVHGQN